jgi:competence protein ComEA
MIVLTKEQQYILLGLIASLVVGFGVMLVKPYFSSANNTMVIDEPSGAVISPGSVVHISGAVRKEGVYRLKPGDRLMDALEAAGGVLPAADLSGLNLAEPIKDGVKIIVPEKKAVMERGAAAPHKINLNTADEKALEVLPGIGAATAKAIVDYRRKNGPFIKIEQIMELPRFGKARFERIKDSVTL